MPDSKLFDANDPTVSIVMPTYNRGDLIGRAIRSVLTQTFKDWELVVVDDCSTDNTREAVQGFDDPRIRYVRRGQNGGPSASRNTGIREARSTQYIAHFDDDDEWLPEKLELQLKEFEKGGPELGVVGCGRLNHTRRGFREVLPRVHGHIFEDVLAGRATGTGTPLLLVKRFPGKPDVLFDENFPCFIDREYLLRISQSYAVGFVHQPLIRVYRDDGGPHVANPANAVNAYLQLLKKYATNFDQMPRVKGYYHACIARELASLREMGRARKHLGQAIQSCRLDPRYYWWFATSYLGARGFRFLLRLVRVTPPK